ncbi:MAG: hypothetical protein U0804_12675 [Gemmataceae bacterium]
MNKYATAALNAARMCGKSGKLSPVDAWDRATTKLFGSGTTGQMKGCPRDAFLGLCGEGQVRGIPPGQYTRSKKNKTYALKAVELLAIKPELADEPGALWEVVMAGEDKNPNCQMDVVAALWREGLIIPAPAQARSVRSGR